MKNYKVHLERIVSLGFILPVLISCQTERFLNWQKNRIKSAEEQRVTIQTVQHHTLQNSRKIRLTGLWRVMKGRVHHFDSPSGGEKSIAIIVLLVWFGLSQRRDES